METCCCIAGGGPAGMMLGFLLARAGVEVVVLEKHRDFLRDFRGDTIHPSTLELMFELGLLEDFLKRPHQELKQIGAQLDDFALTIADFTHLPVHSKFVGLMPQWDFLSFLAEKAKKYPAFQLRMETEVTDLIEENGRIRGVRARTPQGELEVRADLTIGADGRRSVLRQRAGLQVIDSGAPIDVLWMRVPRRPDDPDATLGRVRDGTILVMLNRADYWQCAYLIPKGGFAEIQRRGLEAFRADVVKAAPFLRGRANELKSWDDIKLLSVAVDHLKSWSRPGLLCIGDSAHAMSPVGGVGINLAIQDAVAAANRLWKPLLHGESTDLWLRRVQDRRSFPTRMTQRLQVLAHKKVIAPTLANRTAIRELPVPMRMLRDYPFLRRIPARVVGLGFRPEHVRSPEVS